MNSKKAEAFIHFAVEKHLSHLLPADIIEYLSQRKQQSCHTDELEKALQDWDKKISVQSYWQGVISDYDAERNNALAAVFKQGLFNNLQLKIGYEDNPEICLFNPYGLTIRNRQYFFAGSYEDSQDPCLLAVNKIQSIELTDNNAILPNKDFDLEEFSETYLNHPVAPNFIDHLIIEFPEKAYFYVKSHPICCERFSINPPHGIPGYFNLEAFGVPNTIKLHQWLSGFHDDAQVLTPSFLRRQINRSFVDQLTNLYNRNAFERLGQREIERYYRDTDHHFSLLVMDIDHFKMINDHHGHVFGDDVLVKVAECFRGYDAIRYGGEEFAVLLPDTHAEEAQIAAERIRRNIEELSLKNEENRHVPITISIGIAEFPVHLSEKDKKILNSHSKAKSGNSLKNSLMIAITEQADQALYQAKHSGRNRSIIYQPKTEQ